MIALQSDVRVYLACGYTVSANFGHAVASASGWSVVMPATRPDCRIEELLSRSAGVLVRSAFSEVERHQILDVVIGWAQR